MMHYRAGAGSEPRPCAACCVGDQTDRQTGRGETQMLPRMVHGAESLPRDDRRLLAIMERSSGPPQTTQGACAAAPPLVNLAPSPPRFAPTVLF
eukprot:scaffold10403_cov101-Isochrysis_galbana.AAC.3